jgi:lipopolysaccharide/colanic/teichoic acid biosynthesis glycosyltransferase
LSYVDHLSFQLDLRIAVRTIWNIVSRRGVSQPGQATAASFTGTRADR